ncbi:TspO/MBR family protein [Isoptericola sp. b441]|uniref:TspO/MBR family protein n=1 Tax=Actinotalea lenta TaxID=3064654 RepID=A0ABT9D6W7_9CELL|nr:MULTISPECIES: TspO/MBR family protein [unclassified Isoptericola]MDO8106576.1 TspO/MBR family protein [Isoptericola sp. b441]MDO8121716.1 TspO/MBR family protein [Isoptericola sp. b490]
MRHLPRTAAAVLATAVLGGIGTRPRSAWYLSLRKPSWQPPSSAFGPVWTALYGLVAVASGRALDRMPPERRQGYATALGVNLTLNAAFSWWYFTAERQRAALVDEALLVGSTIDLLRRTARVDRPAAAMLAPYLAWDVFAMALTVAVIRRNPQPPAGARESGIGTPTTRGTEGE